MRTLGMDVSAYKDLVKAMYSSTGPEDDDVFLDIKSEWFLEVAKLSAGLVGDFKSQTTYIWDGLVNKEQKYLISWCPCMVIRSMLFKISAYDLIAMYLAIGDSKFMFFLCSHSLKGTCKPRSVTQRNKNF